MSILKTTQLGESVLRETAQKVEKHDDSHVQQVITDLVDTMRDNDLVGMAAPQIGESLRIFVSEARETKYRTGVILPLQIYINPTITSKSTQTKLGWEGCGSVIGIVGKVERAIELTITYLDREGKEQTDTVNGFQAVIIQHEMDHLNGIMFTDLADPATYVSREYYTKHIQGK